MRGGIDKGLCLLALLFVANHAEDAISSEDLKSGSSHLPEEDSKSAAPSQSFAYSDLDSSQIDDVGDTSEGSSASKSAASASAYSSSGGKSSAQANAQSGVWDTNFLRPGLPSPGFGGSSAQAEAQATANSGLGTGNGYGPGSYGPASSYPLSPGLGSNSAQAKAEAQALANGGGGAGYYPGGNYLKNPGVSSAQAQAEAQALANSGYSPVSNLYQPGYQPQQYQPYYQRELGSNAIAQANAQAEALSQLSGSPIGSGYPIYQNPQQVLYGSSSANALADAQGISSASAEANAHAYGNTDAYSRVIPRHEYIMPHSIPGAKDVVLCSKAGELHYYWSSAYQCLVCTCVLEYGQFIPVCAKCDGCSAGPVPQPSPVPQPVPYPVPEPEPIHLPVTVAPFPQPAPQVTCKPLPSGQPFQNPLNPCQICVCREVFTMQGEPDVQIDCQQNPECVIPPEVTTLPPDVPVPVPMPMCDKFPPNVIFPHPSDVCKVCKCMYETYGLGPIEPKIVCMTLPDCGPRPMPEPATPPPLPMPVPMPTPPEPIPWPVTTPAPMPAPIPGPVPGPGPLPGPAPHESCRPYPPNQPFQHPWDECQECVCAEAYSYGRITIEVNCFTKKSCCYEPLNTEQITISPGPYLPSPTVINQPIQIKGLGINYPGVTGSSAEAQASAISQAGSVPYNPLLTGQPSGSQSLASAEANALAQSSLQPRSQSVTQPWLQPGYQQLQHAPSVPSGYQQPYTQGQGGQYFPVIPGLDVGQPGGNQASSYAEAKAQAQNNQYQLPDQGATPVYSPMYQTLNSQGSGPSPYWMSNSNALAEAEATANALQGYSQPSQYLGNQGGNKQVPYYNGNQGGAGGNNLPIGGSGYGQYGGAGLLGLGSSALAEAEALANTLSGGNYGLPYFGGDLGQGSSASAEAKANAQAGGAGGASLYPGGSPSSLYQTPYNQGYQPGSASAQAQAQSSASGGSSAQSKALASANAIRKLSKSAQDDIDSEEENPVQ